MYARRYTIRTATAITVLALVLAGLPAAYFQTGVRSAEELRSWNEQIIENDASPQVLVDEAVRTFDAATNDLISNRNSRNLFLQLALGIPALAWIGAGVVLRVIKDGTEV
ncbi:hypothetical protein I5W19_03445 [Stenotrophomonas maltophilia]|uniref:hypothetical protein n=1 Tax=Stenotrophomonas muris TaxID=2963283 RepID=UPI0018D4B7EA|nr:hypothetical protein [Stenotrophomonas maltophilia]MCU1036299.1 hypothetical protein [Stenotrophomonas maltophilia]